MQLLFNGVITKEFCPSRGLRQGDPISPYLFVLCIERLAHLISARVSTGQWRPIRMGRGNEKVDVPYLLFADDLLLFVEATHDQATMVKSTLIEFCSISGLKVSEAKTCIFFSTNVPPASRQFLAASMAYTEVDDLGLYLGMPLVHGRVNKHMYQRILDKAESRLSNWKASSLSLAGRLVLTQSVLSTMPFYSMQTVWLPLSILDELEKHCRRFIWGGSTTHRKASLVSWETVCKPKDDGGLRLKYQRKMNDALLMKLGWQLLTRPDTLWVRIMKAKYKLNVPNLLANGNLPKGSITMRAVGKIWNNLMKGIRWSVGDGKRIKFWQDRWLQSDLTLLQACTGLVPHSFIDWTVSNYCTADGQWRWSLFSHLLPAKVLLQIAAVPPPGETSGPDLLYWGFSVDGRFTMKSAYDSLSDDVITTDPWLWRVIWKWAGPQRIRQFMWLVAKNCLMTNSERCRRHLASSSTCELCGLAPESILHTLRDCPKASQVWMQLIPGNKLPDFFALELKQWLWYNLCSAAAKEMEDWSCFFGWCWDGERLVPRKLANGVGLVSEHWSIGGVGSEIGISRSEGR
ncbi:Unknown protein [Striga hermonthica]|uniref:Reverse transcriptase domain-containing protein n=1 Tax=Striga hermonthica TaxID=68872 RepID=A0A9N7N0N6_STRHE|nr:Unknown protein [Striga hermonthica]